MFSSLFWEAENFNLVIFKVQRVFPWEWLERIHAVVHDEESKRLKMSFCHTMRFYVAWTKINDSGDISGFFFEGGNIQSKVNRNPLVLCTLCAFVYLTSFVTKRSCIWNMLSRNP